MLEMIELKPCPFCGTTEMLRRFGALDGEGWGFVRCDYCDAEGPDPDNLKGHWNTRAAPDTALRMLDEIGRLTAALAEAEDRAAAQMRERAAEEAISSAHGGHYVACAIRALPLREPGAT